jgi:hypothetical protein
MPLVSVDGKLSTVVHGQLLTCLENAPMSEISAHADRLLKPEIRSSGG